MVKSQGLSCSCTTLATLTQAMGFRWGSQLGIPGGPRQRWRPGSSSPERWSNADLLSNYWFIFMLSLTNFVFCIFIANQLFSHLHPWRRSENASTATLLWPHRLRRNDMTTPIRSWRTVMSERAVGRWVNEHSHTALQHEPCCQPWFHILFNMITTCESLWPSIKHCYDHYPPHDQILQTMIKHHQTISTTYHCWILSAMTRWCMNQAPSSRIKVNRSTGSSCWSPPWTVTK